MAAWTIVENNHKCMSSDRKFKLAKITFVWNPNAHEKYMQVIKT